MSEGHSGLDKEMKYYSKDRSMFITIIYEYNKLKAKLKKLKTIKAIKFFKKPVVTLEILYFKLYMREHRLERFQDMYKTYPEAMKEHIADLIKKEEKLVKEANELLETYLSSYKKFVRSVHKDPEVS